MNALSYGIMWRYAQTQLLCRNSVIIDCPLARIELFEEAKCMAEQAGTDVFCCSLNDGMTVDFSVM